MQEVRVSLVPDDFDYIWLDEFLGASPDWSTEDVSTARWLLAKQRQALDDAHPRDVKTRERLRGVVDALQRALAEHD
jgi:hypothetical protein